MTESATSEPTHLPITAAAAQEWADGVRHRPLVDLDITTIGMIQPHQPSISFPPCPECHKRVQTLTLNRDAPEQFGVQPCGHAFVIQPPDDNVMLRALVPR